MKRYFLMGTLLFLSGTIAGSALRHWWATVPAQAQAPKVKEPDEIGAVFLLDENQSLKELEGFRGLFAVKGLFGSREVLEIPGLRSKVRFKYGQKIQFVVRTMIEMESPVFNKVSNATNLANPFVLTMKDPTEYELFAISVNQKQLRREVVFSSFGIQGIRGSMGYLNYVTRHGTHSFKLTPVEPLPPGEYAIKYSLDPFDCKEMYCFGID